MSVLIDSLSPVQKNLKLLCQILRTKCNDTENNCSLVFRKGYKEIKKELKKSSEDRGTPILVILTHLFKADVDALEIKQLALKNSIKIIYVANPEIIRVISRYETFSPKAILIRDIMLNEFYKLLSPEELNVLAQFK